MKKIIFKSIKDDLQNKKLTEEQMNELLGGVKCPYCGYDFEPSDLGDSVFTCSGIDPDKEYRTTLQAGYSREEAANALEAKGWSHVVCCMEEYCNLDPTI